MALQLPKFNRQSFYNTVSINGVTQMDFLSFKWIRLPDFLKGKRSQKYRVPQWSSSNLPSISHKFYGDRSLWWILALSNNIISPLSGVPVGTVLAIPNLSDIEDFYQTILENNRKTGVVKLPRSTL